MTFEELKSEAEEWVNKNKPVQDDWEDSDIIQAIIDTSEPREKRIAELEEKISVLLSCKNCPNNKGGFICQKEYEDKCLAQKIQYIKELKEENKQKWHDLRKDPNDLPDNHRYVWTNVGAGHHDDDIWWDDFGRLRDVIAWCEPKFEEE